jgi:hypothetical protein
MKAVLLILVAAVVAPCLCAAAAASPVATESGKRVQLIANCFKPKFKPADVIIACGDASLGARGMTWSTWTRKRADGAGTGQINDCNPDCAHGTTRTDGASAQQATALLQRQAGIREAPLHLDLRAADRRHGGERLGADRLQARRALAPLPSQFQGFLPFLQTVGAGGRGQTAKR